MVLTTVVSRCHVGNIIKLWTLLVVNDAITNGSGKWDPAGSTEGNRILM
jgi:hypothetical protein